MPRVNLPALQIHGGDWRKDPGVQALNYFDRGVWFEILLMMHESEDRGKLLLNGRAMPTEALARVLGLDLQTLAATISNIYEYGVASRDPDTGAMMNRRMVRDEAIRRVRTDAGKKGGNPNLTPRIFPDRPEPGVTPAPARVSPPPPRTDAEIPRGQLFAPAEPLAGSRPSTDSEQSVTMSDADGISTSELPALSFDELSDEEPANGPANLLGGLLNQVPNQNMEALGLSGDSEPGLLNQNATTLGDETDVENPAVQVSETDAENRVGSLPLEKDHETQGTSGLLNQIPTPSSSSSSSSQTTEEKNVGAGPNSFPPKKRGRPSTKEEWITPDWRPDVNAYARIEIVAMEYWPELTRHEMGMMLERFITEFVDYWTEMARIDRENGNKAAKKSSWYLAFRNRVKELGDREQRRRAAERLRTKGGTSSGGQQFEGAADRNARLLREQDEHLRTLSGDGGSDNETDAGSIPIGPETDS